MVLNEIADQAADGGVSPGVLFPFGNAYEKCRVTARDSARPQVGRSRFRFRTPPLETAKAAAKTRLLGFFFQDIFIETGCCA